MRPTDRIRHEKMRPEVGRGVNMQYIQMKTAYIVEW